MYLNHMRMSLCFFYSRVFYSLRRILRKNTTIEIWLALGIALSAILINSFYYQQSLSFTLVLKWMLRYFTFGNGFFLIFFLFIYFLFLKKFYLTLASIVSDYLVDKKPASRHDIKELFLYLLHPIAILAPLAIVSGPAWALLGSMSYELRFTTFDELFLAADAALLGNYPFLALPQALSHDWIVLLLKGFYFSLAGLMGGTLVLLYLLRKTSLFRSFLLAFLSSLLIGFPLFYAFPCQDPANYFLRNLRAHTFAPPVKAALTQYNPPWLTTSIIEDIAKAETDTTQDNRVPISCFPSMHAVWGIFVIYFLFWLTPLSLIITIPWLLLLLTGGVYFAQHYVIDYVVALPVAAASLFLANLLLRFEAWYQHPQTKKAA